MVDYVVKYRKIVDKLIKKSFPELKRKKIIILDFVYRKFTASVFDLSFVVLIFTDSKKAELYSYHELKGLFAHELCHIKRHYNRSFFRKISFIVKYIFNEKTRSLEENETDKLTIKKGYAKNLYQLINKFEKNHAKNILKKRLSKGYLSSKQIKQYAMKIRKWR